MIEDDEKYEALWVSHSSIQSFYNCPREYFLTRVYRNPKTNKRISITNPHLALGTAVHDTLEALSELPVEKRFSESLKDKFEKSWEKIKGEKGGFKNKKQEKHFKEKGEEMIKKVEENPGPLKNKAVKINEKLPQMWLSKTEKIVLCGKIDWLEYIEKNNSVHLIDFKTGKNKEDENSLQLPIYNLLANECQSRKVSKASYWYLREGSSLEEHALPAMEESKERVMKASLQIKEAREKENFTCPKNGCVHCKPFEEIIKGNGKLVDYNEFGNEVYII